MVDYSVLYTSALYIGMPELKNRSENNIQMKRPLYEQITLATHIYNADASTRTVSVST